MNRIKSALTNFMRSSPLRGEDGWVAPRPVMALVAVLLGLVGLGAAAQQQVTTSSTAATPSRSTTIALTSDETAPRRRQSRGEQRFDHSE